MWLIVLLCVAGAGVLVVAYASLVERSWFALRTHRIPCLPAGSDPLRILHVSDLHFRRNLRRQRAFMISLRNVGADLIVGTGDFLGDSRSSDDCADLLGSIPSRLGGVFVLGSNDYYAPVPKNPLRYFRRHRRTTYKHGPSNDWERLTSGLQRHGWRLLSNKTIDLNGIQVSGFDDPHIRRHDLSSAPPTSQDRLNVAVVHSPEVARDLAARGFDLILAGHTHGGQLRLPGYGALVTNCENLPRRMARGVHRLDGSWLHVSAGMGTGKYAPVRFSCRPEACILELVPRS